MTLIISRVDIRGYRKFKYFTFKPKSDINIIVGGNEAGKSTLLEAITLALTGRVNGARVADYLNPYWFNVEEVEEFFNRPAGERTHKDAPEFRIDVYLETDNRDLQMLRGVNNMERRDSVGLSIWAHPDYEYVGELDEYLKEEDCPTVLPVEYYVVEWQSFAGFPISRRPRGLSISMIDSRTIRSERGVDYYTKQILETRLDPKDRNRVSVEHRKLRTVLGESVLQDLNESLAHNNDSGGGLKVGLQVDQSRSTSWENTLVPDIRNVPLPLAGQGNQAVAKTLLAMGRNADTTGLVFIEEPENHLSHTTMRRLISHIEESASGRQVFITTHSSYVLNRLGLNQLILLGNGNSAQFDDLQEDTVRYFKKLSGFDTLRLILAELIVIVEGPSDEMVFNRFFSDRFGREPLDCGIDVMSISGVSFKRCFELAALLDRQLFALRDNDGESVNHWKRQMSPYSKDGARSIFVGEPEAGTTLEPAIEKANSIEQLHLVFPGTKQENISEWMLKHKTDSALEIASSDHSLDPPEYFNEVLEALETKISCQR